MNQLFAGYAQAYFSGKGNRLSVQKIRLRWHLARFRSMKVTENAIGKSQRQELDLGKLIRQNIIPPDRGGQQMRGCNGARQFGQGFNFPSAETAFQLHRRSPEAQHGQFKRWRNEFFIKHIFTIARHGIFLP
jgi:hypothetical protein